jgi:hypothetical protein
MGLKTELTQKVSEYYNFDDSPDRRHELWWRDPRDRNTGFWLTKTGFEAFTQAGIKSYPIKFEEELYITNQLTIWLNRHMPCPFYITPDQIYVFSENMAVQLMLFSGNVERFIRAKVNKLKD